VDGGVAQARSIYHYRATKQQITEYARELGRGLPDARDPVAYAQQAEAVQPVVREILS
jgi:hypothetical protein